MKKVLAVILMIVSIGAVQAMPPPPTGVKAPAVYLRLAVCNKPTAGSTVLTNRFVCAVATTKKANISLTAFKNKNEILNSTFSIKGTGVIEVSPVEFDIALDGLVPGDTLSLHDRATYLGLSEAQKTSFDKLYGVTVPESTLGIRVMEACYMADSSVVIRARLKPLGDTAPNILPETVTLSNGTAKILVNPNDVAGGIVRIDLADPNQLSAGIHISATFPGLSDPYVGILNNAYLMGVPFPFCNSALTEQTTP